MIITRHAKERWWTRFRCAPETLPSALARSWDVTHLQYFITFPKYRRRKDTRLLFDPVSWALFPCVGTHEKVVTAVRLDGRYVTVLRQKGFCRLRPGFAKAGQHAVHTETILDALCVAEGSSAGDIERATGLTPPEVRRELQELEALGLVTRTGDSPNAQWWTG